MKKVQDEHSRKYSVGVPGGEIHLPSLVTQDTCLEKWEIDRDAIRHRLLCVLGQAPQPTALSWHVLYEKKEENFSLQKIAYSSCDGETATGYLLIPNKVSVQMPAVLALHPTDIACAESVLIQREDCEENYPYGYELVQRGFVVFAPDLFVRWHCPDAVSLDQRYNTNFLEQKHPQWSAMGRAVYDHRQALNLLCSLPYVDSKRIGVIGHSLGGTNALLLAALDERVQATAVSCCLCSFCCHPNVQVWCRESGFCYFPAFRQTISEGFVPFEWMEVLACTAPRPMYIFQAKRDMWFPRWDGAGESVKRAQDIYRLYHRPEYLKWVCDLFAAKKLRKRKQGSGTETYNY